MPLDQDRFRSFRYYLQNIYSKILLYDVHDSKIIDYNFLYLSVGINDLNMFVKNVHKLSCFFC